MNIDHFKEANSLMGRRQILLEFLEHRTQRLLFESIPVDGYKRYVSFELPNPITAKQKAQSRHSINNSLLRC